MPCRVSPPPSSTVIVEWRRDGIPLSTHRSVETHTHTQHNFTFCHCLWLFLPLTFSSGITSSPTAPCWSALSLSQTLVGSCAWLLVNSREITATFTCLSQVMQQHLYEILSWVYSHTLTVQEFLNQSLYNVTKIIHLWYECQSGYSRNSPNVIIYITVSVRSCSPLIFTHDMLMCHYVIELDVCLIEGSSQLTPTSLPRDGPFPRWEALVLSTHSNVFSCKI